MTSGDLKFWVTLSGSHFLLRLLRTLTFLAGGLAPSSSSSSSVFLVLGNLLRLAGTRAFQLVEGETLISLAISSSLLCSAGGVGGGLGRWLVVLRPRVPRAPLVRAILLLPLDELELWWFVGGLRLTVISSP